MDAALGIDLEAALREEPDGFGDQAALRGLDPCGQGLDGVVFEHRDGLLEDDRAVVVLLVGEVHRGAGHLHPLLEDGFVDLTSVETLAGEGGNQGRVDVDGASFELAAQLEDGEEAEERDELHAVLLELRVNQVVELAEVAVALAGNRDGRDTAPLRAATVQLDLVVDPAGHTWQVFAEVQGGSAGLDGFSLDVVGTDGLTVVDSLNRSPTGFDGTDAWGFFDLRSDGAAGLGVMATQDSVYGSTNDPAKDALVLTDVGIGTMVVQE